MKNYIIAGITGFVALVLALLLVGFIQGRPVALGATSSLDSVNNPYTSINGFNEFSETIPWVATSSFVASIKNPFGNATTSIEVVSFSSTRSLLGTNNIYVSTSTTAYGTSTPAIAIFPVPSFQPFSFNLVRNMATSTTGGVLGTGNADILPGEKWLGGGTAGGGIGGSNYILGPNEYLNINIATTTAGTFVNYLTGNGVTVRIRRI